MYRHRSEARGCRLPGCTLALIALACLLASCAAIWGLVAAEVFPSPTPVPPTPAIPTPLPPTTPLPPQTPDPVALETEARLNETVVPIHDPVVLRPLLAHDTASPTPPTPAPDYRPGDRRRFRLNGSSVEAELVHATEHVYAWLVVGVEADREALVAAAEHFEEEIYPTVRRYFGSEWSPGVDGDVHLSILHYYDPDDDAAGSFAPTDQLPRWIEPTSNETEMFYINLDGMEPGEEYYYAVLAHEFQHMIHWHNDRNETDWLDEGLAELACRLAGFDPGDSDESFHQHPDTQLNHWPYDEDTTVHYGAGYRFALYLWERFGDDFIWDLAHHPADGMASLDAVLAARGIGVTADDVFADWVVVNALDEGEYAYANEGWKGSPAMDATHDRYPISRKTDVHPYGTDYIELLDEGQLLIRFQGTTQTRLLPVDPHTGSRFWWSNQGNRSDSRLIRRFDLSGLSQATLRFWTWYDLESGYDYVYLSASDDGGQTWEVLQTRYANRRGDYGWAYNGRSDGWVEDEVDLGRYAGGEVQIRFDYVTDGSINGAGFLLDDLSIPELGLSDPCEEEGDWQAEGFVLVGPMVPVRWAVQLIEFPAGGTPRVRRMPLDAQQSGRMELDLGGEVERAWLAISALTRGTTEPVPYQYEVVLR